MTPGLDENLSMTRSGNTYYYMADGLGSVRNIGESDEDVANTYDYYAFGTTLGTPTEGVTNPYGFTAREYESGSIGSTYYYRNRYYLSALGIFASRDIVEEDIVRGFRYVGNSPTMKGDPDGHSPVLVGTAAVAALIGIVAVCAYPQYNAAFSRYPDSGDKFKHCWVSCRISKVCGGVIAELAGLGKEARDRAVGVYCLLNPDSEICQGGHGDFWDSIADLAANQQCVGWESFLGMQWIGALCRRSCEDCCKEKVGY